MLSLTSKYLLKSSMCTLVFLSACASPPASESHSAYLNANFSGTPAANSTHAPERQRQFRLLLANGQEQEWRNPEQALSFYTQAIALHPNSAEAFHLRASLHERHYRRNNNFSREAAMQDYSTAFALEPEDPRSLIARQTLAQTPEERVETATEFEKAITLKPNVPELHFFYARLLIGLGRQPEAKTAIDSAINLNDKEPNYFDLRSRINVALGNPQAATQDRLMMQRLNQENERLRNNNLRLRDGLDQSGRDFRSILEAEEQARRTRNAREEAEQNRRQEERRHREEEQTRQRQFRAF